MTKASPARLTALSITRQIRERKAYAHDLIEKQLRDPEAGSKLSPEERDFAILLIKGVVATSGELDYLLDRALKKGSIKPKVRDALRISTYELFFLDKEPFAAVSQGVELVRSLSPYVAGFANKVLRNVAALKTDFPFGDPSVETRALAHAQAFPLWLTERLIADLGFGDASLFMQVSNTPAPLFLTNPDIGVMIRDKAVNLPEYLDGIESGELIVADFSAQTVAGIATPPKQEPFLEVGSGRGTKTVLLAKNSEREYGGRPQIYALDLHPFKQGILQERIRRYGLEGVFPVTGDAIRLPELIAEGKLPEWFAGALIDAPCSGTGTLRRNPEIRWRLTADEVGTMAAQGLAMLRSLADHIAPGGFVVYATCSVLKEENEQVVEAFLAGEAGKDFHLESLASGGGCYFRPALTEGSADSHFAAKLVRRGPDVVPSSPYDLHQNTTSKRKETGG